MCGSTGTLSYSVVIDKHDMFAHVLGRILIGIIGLASTIVTIYITWNLLMAALRWFGHILGL